MLYQSSHIKKSGKGWKMHTVFSLFAGVVLIVTGVVSIIHAIIPNLFPKLSEKIIVWLLHVSKKQ